MQVTAVPAMMPFRAAVPRFTIGAGGATFVTITVALPEMAPLVACTVLLNVPVAAPAVNKPVDEMVPPRPTDQTGMIGMTLPLASRPTAVNCCVPFVCTVAGFGVTVIVASTGAGATITTTVAEPKVPPTVACTVLVNVPPVGPAVKTPVLALMVPPLFTTDHTGMMVTVLPLASLPTAVNCCVKPGASVTGFGLTTMLANGPAETMTVAVPLTLPLVALTVLENVPAMLPAVNTPVLGSIVPPPLTTDHTAVMGTALPFASVPMAVNCCDAPVANVTGLGVTRMLASGPVTIVTVALPLIAPLVARTVLAYVAVAPAAVNKPELASIEPPPLVTDQTGVMATTLPLASVPTAVNCCVKPGDSVTGLGVTLMVASGPAVTMTVAVPLVPPIDAWTVFVYVPMSVPAVKTPA